MATAQLIPLPPEDAIRVLLARGRRPSPTFAWQDAYAAHHAAMFTVAKSAGFDILQDIFNTLSKALQEGRTLRDFARELTPVLQAKGWWGRQMVTDPLTGEQQPAQLGSLRRLETIFNANMRVSYAAGHWANFERNKRARPFLRYVAIRDDRTRPEHLRRHNLVLPVDHPYWDVWAPPCGWNCRCTLQSLSQRDIDQLQAEREELRFEPPVDELKSWVNKRTGEVHDIPVGIDPGWNYNPGRAGANVAINEALAQKAAGAPFELLEPLVAERVRSDAFARFLEKPEGSMPVMPIPPAIAEAAGTAARVAILSADTMQKQLRRHPEMTLADYRTLPSIGANPTLVFRDGANTFVLVKLDDGRWRYVAAKTTKTGKAAFVTSFRYASDENVQRMLSRDNVKVLVDKRGK
ncbi:SPP1 gp7 family putative phage head morphogenesis protein [Sinorhizobium fredii]|uniref:phage head morphogenesis protein n=1 Tax=Rhizobium fredii TaxID=380 RepID=UPI00351102FC